MRTSRRPLLAALVVGIVVVVLLPVVGYLTPLLRPAGPAQPAEANTTLTLPFQRGDYFRLLHSVVLRDLGSNTTHNVLGEVITVRVLEVGWPFTTVEATAENRTSAVQLPTFLLGLPLEMLGKNVSAPVPVFLFSDVVCMPFGYSGKTLDGETYVASTPETCKSIVVYASYFDNGVLNKASLHYTIGDTIYQELYEMAVWSTNGETRLTVPSSSMRLCSGYYSRNLMLTLPGAYVFMGREVAVSYRFDEVVNATPLLVLSKSAKNQVLWEKLPDAYRGAAIVVSPMLRDFWLVPHLEDVEKYGAVLVLPGNRTVVGTENVTRYLVSQP